MAELLAEAERVGRAGMPSAAVVLSHFAIEAELKRRLRSRSPWPYREIVSKAWKEGVNLDVNAVLRLGVLKNRVIYEGYRPTNEEVIWSLNVARRTVRATRRQGVLARASRWLSER
jgi:hypothetical protein